MVDKATYLLKPRPLRHHLGPRVMEDISEG